MSSGHDNHDNHSNELKTVSFRTPMILALVTVLAIVLLVSTCDNKNCCKEGEKCEETTGHNEHGGHDKEEAHGNTEKQEGATIINSAEENPVTDSLSSKINNSTDTAKTVGHTH